RSEDSIARRINRSRSRDATALTQAGERLLSADDEPIAIRHALRTAVETTGLSTAILLQLRGARLHVTGRWGPLPEAVDQWLRHGVPLGHPGTDAAWSRRHPALYEDLTDSEGTNDLPFEQLGVRATATVPVQDAAGTTTGLLVVADAERTRRWAESDRAFLVSLATMLGAALQRLTLARQMHELLAVVRTVAQAADPQEAYDRAVDAAVRLLPSAETASLLVRDGEAFQFAATHGFDLEALRSLGHVGMEQELRWYRLGRDAFERGVPRRLQGADIQASSAAAIHDGDQAVQLASDGRVAELAATVCVPIVVGRDVLAILNVDNLSRADAFSNAELELAEAFGQQFGVIVRQAQTREALARAAVTDPVTGLGNREGFNLRLGTEMARARRHQHPLHLVMMDLDGFKRINDRLGHHVGDRALRTVADALRAERRGEDGLFRWGGDEFVLLLSDTSVDQARTAARRYADRIATLAVDGMPLTASIGIASWPDDAQDEDALLRIADDLMYRGKERNGATANDATANDATTETPS
ncbi:MAG: sensor domain-containing diguanylate cyclase, partial [Trueperaceae bacterium]